MPIRCRYCDELLFKNSSMIRYLLNDDPLCARCRQSLTKSIKTINVQGIKINTLYLYDDHFRSLIIQYKEGNDEALKDCFLFPFKRMIAQKYRGYTLTWVPSSNSKLTRRGFDHMAKMTEGIRLEKRALLYKIHDRSQDGNDRYKMQSNFACLTGRLPSKILLIDDVITTGASFCGAYRALKRPNNTIKCIAVAHSSHFINQ